MPSPILDSLSVLMSNNSVQPNVRRWNKKDPKYSKEQRKSCTGRMGWMAHRKLKEIKQQPGTARPGNMLGCYLIIPVRHQPYPPCTVFPAHCNKLLFVTFFCQHTVFPFISGGRVARSRVSPPKQTSLILFNICYCDLHVFWQFSLVTTISQ